MQFHENPSVIAWWSTKLAKPLTWLNPSRRRITLAFAAVAAGFFESYHALTHEKELPIAFDLISASFVVMALFGFLYLVYRCALNFSKLPLIVRRHPQLALHALYLTALLVVWNTSPQAGMWHTVILGVAFMLPYLLWRCGYLLLAAQYGRIANTRFTDHLFYLWPAYGGTNTPYGKGFVYLTQNEAKTNEELARSQLAGIKLFILAVVLGSAQFLLEGLFYGEGNALTKTISGHVNPIPPLGQLIKQGSDAPQGLAWVSVYCEFVKQVLRHASSGHLVIGMLRLFGFNVFRNTYKPLLAESIVEFWNRYFYYFKELLANFFFIPTFTNLGKHLKNWPKLRMFLAVFAAAFIGNMYYHILQEPEQIVAGDVASVVYKFRSRFFYCFLLATGIYLSMLRQQNLRGKTLSTDILSRLMRMFGVWTFFSLIFIWCVRSRAGFLDRTDFFLGLFCLA